MAGVIEDYITFVKGPTVPGIWGGMLASEFVAETTTVAAGLPEKTAQKELGKAATKVGFSLVPFAIARGTKATGDAELALSAATAVSLAGALQNIVSVVIPGSPGKDPGTEAGQAIGNWIRGKIARPRAQVGTGTAPRTVYRVNPNIARQKAEVNAQYGERVEELRLRRAYGEA